MTTQLLTVTLSTGEAVLAKSSTEPLRYGNLSAAQKKLDSIQPFISSARSASIVKLDGRFLILIYDNPKYLKLFTSIVHKTLDRQFKLGFATVTGQRQNPRNRHNHNHKDQTDKPYHFGG